MTFVQVSYSVKCKNLNIQIWNNLKNGFSLFCKKYSKSDLASNCSSATLFFCGQIPPLKKTTWFWLRKCRFKKWRDVSQTCKPAVFLAPNKLVRTFYISFSNKLSHYWKTTLLWTTPLWTRRLVQSSDFFWSLILVITFPDYNNNFVQVFY